MDLDEDYANLGRINKSIYESNLEAFMGSCIQEDRQSVLGLGKLITDMQELQINQKKNMSKNKSSLALWRSTVTSHTKAVEGLGFDIFHFDEYVENDYKDDKLHLTREEESLANDSQFDHIRSRYDSIHSANDVDI